MAPGTRLMRLGLLCVILLLAACGTSAPMSARQSKAVEYNQRAMGAFQRGEYRTAADLYELSLQLDSSIENVDGMAINLLNLSRSYQALGNRARAMQCLDALLNEKALKFRPEHLAAAALQKSALQLQSGDVESASQWLSRGEAYCTSDCRLQGSMANLRAAIALHQQDGEKAAYWAGRGISQNGKDVPVEYANSLRLLGQAKLLKGEVVAALADLEQALSEDKALGVPEKVAQDLALLAEAHDKKGDAELARHYRARAARVSAAPK